MGVEQMPWRNVTQRLHHQRLHPGGALPVYTRSSWSSARAQVIALACCEAAVPSCSASETSSITRPTASASAAASGATTNPLVPSTTSSVGPPLSVQVITALRDANASTVTRD